MTFKHATRSHCVSSSTLTEGEGVGGLVAVALPPQDVVDDATPGGVREEHVFVLRQREPAAQTNHCPSSQGHNKLSIQKLGLNLEYTFKVMVMFDFCNCDPSFNVFIFKHATVHDSREVERN